MAELQPNIVFHGRHFVRHLGICNPICLKFLQVMSGIILNNLKEKWRLYLKPFSWGPQTRHTHTHRHDDGIRRNAMRCISPKNTTQLLSSGTPAIVDDANRFYVLFALQIGQTVIFCKSL